MFRVRDVEEKHLNEIRALDRQVLPVRYDDDFYRGLTGDLFLARCVEDSESGRVVACVTGFIKKKATDVLRIGYGNNFVMVLYMCTFCVLPSHQRRGVGRLLFEDWKQLALEVYGIDVLSLHVKSLNLSALAFYEKMGFHQLKLKPLHYSIQGRRYDAFKMALALSENGAQHLKSISTTWIKWAYEWIGLRYDDPVIQDGTDAEVFMVDEKVKSS